MNDPVVPFDLQRMLVGNEPIMIYLEIVVRSILIYAYALLLLRWLGSRTIGQLSTIEFLLVIALGSAVGDPMFQPDIPLLHAMLVVTVVVVLNKGLDLLVAGNKTAERVIDGEAVQLVEAGVIARRVLETKSLGRNEIFQQLRRQGVRQLGEIDAAFVEPNGDVSIFRARTPAAGLPIMPPWEVSQPPVIDQDVACDAGTRLACMNCGTVITTAEAGPGYCPYCGHGRWTHPAATASGDVEKR